jgi:diguanylate cyclase (GGDEF)-like protein
VDLNEPRLQVDQSYLDQFNTLQKSGALDDLASLRNENRVLDSLINDAAKLYGLSSVEETMDFVTKRILDQFIPTYLLVVFEPPRGGALTQYCYANLKPSDRKLSSATYQRLKAAFLPSPYLKDFVKVELSPRAIVELSSYDPDVVIPLCGIEGIFGVAVFGRKVLGEPYTPVERMYIDKFMRFISIGIQNTLHHQSSITDPKTGLYNHGYFAQRVEQELARITRHDGKAGLVMLDIDHFKRFNDTYGHLAGDEVLSSLASTLKRTVRTEDIPSRFGGEEFCVLAIECDPATLMEMAERIRLSIEATQVPYKSESLSVTASLGCCCFDPDLPYSCDAYVEMADKALYLSKSGGRNKSTLYRPRLLDRAEAFRKRDS